MQFFLYLIVGGLSFVVDIGAFVLLRMADIAVIPASVISFIAATSVNYLLSIALAFQSRRFRRHIELVRFLAVVFVGLALNTMLVCLFVYSFSIYPTIAKVIAVPIVFVWNYLGRRMLVFHNQLPTPMLQWLSSAREGRRTAAARSAARQALRSSSRGA